MDVLLPFLVISEKLHLLEYLISLQSLLTINIILQDINFELLEETVKLIDFLWQVN